ncbi:MAG: short chain dehydrogenase [Acidimicrobiaceae bacterium]|nr:short chain dehydrogenase [Acidimicrobiaceae bacterium]
MYRVPNQEGKLCVVTGANSGLGKEAARRLAGAGASVIMAVRNVDKGEAARDALLALNPDARLEVRRLDLANLSSVRAFADQLIADDHPIDILLNNGGVMAPPQRALSADGFELQFATNFLGHYVVTLRLLPLILTAAGPSVTTVSSVAAQFGRIRFNDIQSERHYIAYRSYAQSKLADLLFAQQLARLANQRNWDLMSNAAHPGLTRTNLFNARLNVGRDTHKTSIQTRLAPSQGVEQGVEPILYAATSPDAISGAYYGPRGLFGLAGVTTLVKAPRSARHPETAERLWKLAAELSGENVPAGL